MTGEFAYKTKRPVQHSFVGQRSLELRGFLCHEEVRLNFSGLREQPRSILAQMGVKPDGTGLQFARDFAEAVAQASSTP